MTKFEEMQARLDALIKTMQGHLDADELDKAESVKAEIDTLKKKMENQEYLDSILPKVPDSPVMPTVPTDSPEDSKTKENASFIRACIKKFSGRQLTERENALLLPTGTDPNPDGDYNEGYILPQDIKTKIHKRIREYRSLREVCGSMITTALTGSYPVENIDSLTGLVDFTDGTDMEESNDVKFDKVSFALKEKGALIQLSNTLLALTDNDLIAYIVDVFAKKAVITENAMAVAALTKDKTIKKLESWRDLKISMNIDLDPAALHNTVIVTNQDAFNHMDTDLDGNGRPVMQPDPTNPTIKRFLGYPVIVFSNSMLPTVTDDDDNEVAPIFYGNLAEGVKFVDLDIMSFAVSKEAGFTKNTTYARLIEFIDVIQNDASDKCYIAGEFKVDRDSWQLASWEKDGQTNQTSGS